MSPTEDPDPERVGPVNTRTDSQHLILGDVELSVRIENAPELPAPDYITRDGWDEDGTANYPEDEDVVYSPSFIQDVQTMIAAEESEDQNVQLFMSNKPSEEGYLAGGSPCKLTGTSRQNGDGVAEAFDFGFSEENKRDNINNSVFAARKSAPPQFTSSSMDRDQERSWRPAASPSSVHVRPLQPRKISSQTHLARSQPHSNSHKSHEIIPAEPTFPTRTSSIRSHTAYCDPATSQHLQMTTKVPSDLHGDEVSLAANGSDHRHNNLSTNARSPTNSTDKSTDLSSTSHLLSKSPSAIMGDFVPIDSPNMAGLTPDLDPADELLRDTFRPFVGPKFNPYEFEPSTPYNDLSRQTTFTDFIKKGLEVPSRLTPRATHVKNARSEGNGMPPTQIPTHLAVSPVKFNGYPLHRSESSPNVSQLPIFPHRDGTPSAEILQYYTEGGETGSPAGRARQKSPDSTPRGCQNIGMKHDYQSSTHRHQDHAHARPSRSHTHHPQQGSLSKGSAAIRNMPRDRSPTKTLGDVSEHDEYDDSLANGFLNRSSNISDSCSPKKRSRSPMKKMFGENGWLGRSPDEKPVLNMQPKKKVGMMEKLKNKFEEIAEKADLSPMGRPPPNSDKKKQTVLAISLGPPEQARVYMEIELMLVHTANAFLMNQFSQGRMDIDSVKKTVERWKNKGRPVVIEFMYDQATQRELVVANQQNFRFHGDNAGSDIRINSMLYNWKQVANLMCIRTFCNADTVILKLLFDIEQILELLGAVEPMMIRLQQIRATASEMMRVARLSKDSKATSQPSFRGRELPRNSESSTTSTLYSMDDPYGGMKLVPDNYKE